MYLVSNGFERKLGFHFKIRRFIFFLIFVYFFFVIFCAEKMVKLLCANKICQLLEIFKNPNVVLNACLSVIEVCLSPGGRANMCRVSDPANH